MNLVKLQDIKLICRNPLHSYILPEKTEREIKETISFIIATKRIKYLGINLPKETKDLYIENYDKALMKEIKDDTKRWRNICLDVSSVSDDFFHQFLIIFCIQVFCLFR